VAALAARLMTGASSLASSAPRGGLVVFSQHQVAAILATALDYAVMIACVSVVGLSAPLGTALGSLVGAVANFTLGRRWVFQSTTSAIRGQAWRYAFVSLCSLGFETGGEKLMVAMGLNYIIARLIASCGVGMLWNYPLHRAFVFKPRESSAAAKCHSPQTVTACSA
jgi:putative flippase GtrA